MSDETVRETVTKGIKDYTLKMHVRATGAIVKACILIEGATTKNLKWKKSKTSPPGGRASGALQKSYGHRVISLKSRGVITGIVGTNSKYAGYVEGTNRRRPLKRHFVPFDVAPGLRQWAKSHKLPKAWWGPKSEGMMVGGPGSITPHLKPAFDKKVRGAQRIIMKALKPR